MCWRWGCCSDDKKPTGIAAQIDKKLGGAIAKVMKLGDFKAKANSNNSYLYQWRNCRDGVLLVGLGERKKIKLEGMRKAAAAAANQAVAMQAKTMAVAIHQAVEEQFEIDETCTGDCRRGVFRGVSLG